VAVPPLRLNEDARIPLAKTRDALDEANSRLSEGADWYEGVRERAANPEVK
jgi:hypothetical protein